MSEPTTAAGRALHHSRHDASCHDCGLWDKIAAIEAEARAAALDEARAAVEQALDRWMDETTDNGALLDILLAAIDALWGDREVSEKTPFQRVTDDLTGGCGCACHVGIGYRTSCEHCRLPADPPASGDVEAAHRFDHDGMWRHHHADRRYWPNGEAIWWTNVDEFGGEKREHTHPPASETVDGLPRCEHGAPLWACYATSSGTPPASETVEVALSRAESGGLDVEWLAEALKVVDDPDLLPSNHAAEVAAEYARLAEDADACVDS